MFELIEGNRETTAKIKVIGIGGGGGNAVNRMVTFNLSGVDFITANTDGQALRASKAAIKTQLGEHITKGLGAGSDPDVGKRAVLESKDVLRDNLTGADMVFITAGMGGGTGTGGAPVLAEIAKDLGALTVAVVTKPFSFEGKVRERQAEEGIRELEKIVDSLIIIPNQRLLNLGDRSLKLSDAFNKADDVLYHAVKGISDLILFPADINLDFADVKKIMSGMGLALMGTGFAEGEGKAVEAARMAMSSPLLEENSMQGAKGVLLSIIGGPDMTIFELQEAADLIRSEAHDDANIIFGTSIDEGMDDGIRVTIIATGFEGNRNRIQASTTGKVAPFSSLKREDMSKPAYLRKGKAKEDKAQFVKMGLIDDDDNMIDYETPAFLRKKAD